MAKIRNFDSFAWGLYSYISALINVKFDMSPLPMPNFTFIGERCRPYGGKPIFGPLSKNNTGMAALRAGLPVTSIQKVGLQFLSSA